MEQKLEIASMQHSELGPSASDRWLNCPGSVRYTRGMERKTTIYAAEGNAAHELSEWCRLENKSAVNWKGSILSVSGFDIKVDDEMVEAIDKFVEFTSRWAGVPLCEERVDYQEWVPGGFGTLDDARLRSGFCPVTDLKYGKGVRVSAEDNTQLKLYALGLYSDYKHLCNFDIFGLTIHQPRLDNVETFEVRTSDLLEWANDYVKPIAAKALQPGADFKAGKWCMFCAAKNVCPTKAVFDAKKESYDSDFGNLDGAEEPVSIEDWLEDI